MRTLARYVQNASLLALVLSACEVEEPDAADGNSDAEVTFTDSISAAVVGSDRRGEREKDRKREDTEDKKCDEDLKRGRRKALQPKVTCVEATADGKLRAHWGYKNTHKKDITRKIGQQTKFSP